MTNLALNFFAAGWCLACALVSPGPLWLRVVVLVMGLLNIACGVADIKAMRLRAELALKEAGR